MTTQSAADEPAINLSDRERLEILGAILLALFLFALDQTVVGTALPVIITDLHGNDLYTWAVTIYLLTARSAGRSTASCPTCSGVARSSSSRSACS